MAFSSGGSLGSVLYATDDVEDKIISISTDGTRTDFATGFNSITSISVDSDGEYMYVSDQNSVYRISSSNLLIGPIIVMQEPKVEKDGVHTNPLGVDDLTFLWSEPIVFNASDVNIINDTGSGVPFTVSNSPSEFMVISFGETLLHDKYTITIDDVVISAETGNPIDGDKNGQAGGDAVIILEHRQRHDSDNDNDIDLYDLAELAEKWLWQE